MGSSPFRLWPLFVETFVSTVAVMSFVALVGPISRSLGLAEWQAGATVTGAGVGMVLCARPWGMASDRYGRRRVLLIGVFGFALAYALLCAVILSALTIQLPVMLTFIALAVSRMIAGGFYAAVPAAGTALVADHVERADRVKTLAKLGAASALGMVLGPGMAGTLARYDLRIPLYVTVLLPWIACLVLWRTLPQEAARGRKDVVRLQLIDPRLRRPLVTAFVAMSSVIVAQLSVGFFAIDRLHLSPQQGAQVAGLAMTCVGVALIAAQISVQKLAWPPLRFIRTGGIVSAIGFLAAVWATQPWMIYTSYFVMAAGMGWIFPSMSALAANSVEAHEQGGTAGAMGAMNGVAAIVAPLLATGLYGIDPRVPYVVAAGALLIVMPWPADKTTHVEAAASAPAG